MSDKPDTNVQPEWLRDRYAGLGGTYVVIAGERFPADEAGRPLPHTRNPDGTPLVPGPATPIAGDDQE